MLVTKKVNINIFLRYSFILATDICSSYNGQMTYKYSKNEWKYGNQNVQ